MNTHHRKERSNKVRADLSRCLFRKGEGVREETTKGLQVVDEDSRGQFIYFGNRCHCLDLEVLMAFSACITADNRESAMVSADSLMPR